MPRALFLVTALLAHGGVPHVTWAAARASSALQTAAESTDDAFLTVEGAYKSAQITYNEQRIKAARKQGEAPTEHPAHTFWARFEKVALDGSAAADAWLAANVVDAFSAPQMQVEKLETVLERLLTRHPEHEAVVRAQDGLRRAVDALGVDKTRGWLERIATQSTNREAQARAIMNQAWLRSGKDRTPNVAAREEARELYRSVIFGFAGTLAGREAAEALHPEVERDFLEAERAWIEQVLQLQAQSKPASEWPKQPIHAHKPNFVPLAEAGNARARTWVDSLYPSYSQSESNGVGHSLAWLSRSLGDFYPQKSPEWCAVRMGLLEIGVRHGPTEAWITSALRQVYAAIDQLAPHCAAKLCEAVLAKSEDSTQKALALGIQARTERAAGDQRSYERALASYKALVTDYADEMTLVEQATAEASALERVMPGHAALPLQLGDSDGQKFDLSSYRGQIVMLEFWSSLDEACTRSVPERKALIGRLHGRGFNFAGVSVDRMTNVAFNTRARELGADWRFAMLYSGSDPRVLEWQVRAYPTTILIDAEGRIRARDLPWAEMCALAETLVSELEASAPKK